MKRTVEEKKQDLEYLNSLLTDPRISSLSRYVHHKHSNRLNHVIGVTNLSLKWAYMLRCNCDYHSLIRGALLHDYYAYDQNKREERIKWHWIRHPRYALASASNDFDLTDVEKDIIISHMWPVTLFHISHTKEGWLVNLADTVSAVHDFFHKDSTRR